MRLTDRIENLVLKRDALHVRLGAAAGTSREASLLEQEMQRLQAQRAAVDAELVQAATGRR
jgi:predicted  nucleic acid-binding Zn-ribbon protein